jgi:hypothetical protein
MTRKGGRPRARVPGSRVCAWLTVHEHDRLIAIALQRRQSVSSLVKELLRPVLRRVPSDGVSGIE